MCWAELCPAFQKERVCCFKRKSAQPHDPHLLVNVAWGLLLTVTFGSQQLPDRDPLFLIPKCPLPAVCFTRELPGEAIHKSVHERVCFGDCHIGGRAAPVPGALMSSMNLGSQ